jgi:prefoldin subunit 5
MEKEELLVEIGTGFYVEKTPKTSYLEPLQRNQSELALRNEETSSDFMMEDNKSTTDG